MWRGLSIDTGLDLPRLDSSCEGWEDGRSDIWSSLDSILFSVLKIMLIDVSFLHMVSPESEHSGARGHTWWACARHKYTLSPGSGRGCRGYPRRIGFS